MAAERILIKLIQVNIWGGRLGKQVIAFLQDERPDIVCLQEAISADGKLMLAKTVEEIGAATNLNTTFFSPTFSFDILNKPAKFGNAIITNTILAPVNTVFTNLEYNESFDVDNDDYNIRNLQHARVEINHKTVHILNHHARHIRQHKNGDDQTLKQCGMVADYIASLEGPVILAGDFNLTKHSESLELLNKELQNLSITYNLSTTRNELTSKDEVCDYIFVSDSIHVNAFHVADKLISDHKALILEFDL